METRKDMSQQFIAEVLDQANAYGVETMSIEFMDIRDSINALENLVGGPLAYQPLVDFTTKLASGTQSRRANLSGFLDF